MDILAIESSCDETAAAIIRDGIHIQSSIIASSAAMQQKFGGIVPEVAAREQLRSIIPTIQETISQANIDIEKVDAIAVTIGPGLIGSLLIGVEAAKTIAMVYQKPIIPVNHVLAHIYANFINQPDIQFPAIALVVSGGHTELFLIRSHEKITWLGGTVDDAAGEAFDKSARLLGFGHGGGPAIQMAAAKKTNKIAIALPRPLLHDGSLNFSFSGLKTAINREWNKRAEHTPEYIADYAFEIQEAITDVLTAKTITAAQQHQAQSILVAGGVAANLRLREKFATTLKKKSLNIPLYIPPIHLCTDNAVAIGAYAYYRGEKQDWQTVTALPNLSVEINEV